MRFLFFFLFAVLIALLSLLFGPPVEAKNQDVGLWLARSCVGEAGWFSGDTGECAAIAHVYRKRAEIGRQGFYKAMRQYSAALKRRKAHPRKWLFDLNREGTRPEGWPRHLRWERFKGHWLTVLKEADSTLKGETPDPLPDAVHYGASIDSPPANVERLRVPYVFLNRFYKLK